MIEIECGCFKNRVFKRVDRAAITQYIRNKNLMNQKEFIDIHIGGMNIVTVSISSIAAVEPLTGISCKIILKEKSENGAALFIIAQMSQASVRILIQNYPAIPPKDQ